MQTFYFFFDSKLSRRQRECFDLQKEGKEAFKKIVLDTNGCKIQVKSSAKVNLYAHNLQKKRKAFCILASI